ncbi:hypothetical protein R0L47_13485 [Pectobacterium polonicum]|uniref:hypothetical protein n=1 Tax=Pectobacterium polonicum TaxID=2485124 RepID=UPI0010F472BE|nr:hypothetical protein [Pectobacterium polonicum]
MIEWTVLISVIGRLFGGVELAYSLEPSLRVSHVPLHISLCIHSIPKHSLWSPTLAGEFPFMLKSEALGGGLRRAVR